jgi:3'5'-cyclic nucleotide phosphodiesterase
VFCRHWLTEREAQVDCKGKGMMTTFWCEPNCNVAGSVVSASDASEIGTLGRAGPGVSHEAEFSRLLDWNVTLFAGLLEAVVASQDLTMTIPGELEGQPSMCSSTALTKPVDGVQEELDLLKSCQYKAPERMADLTPLSCTVMKQLRELMASIAQLYRDNPFHNFEHCSHVVMSARKMLNRIADHEKEIQHQTSSTKSFTFGVTSSPLCQFGIVFAALIHDLDHSGMSNARLEHEKHPLVAMYDGKSVAEQNSIDVGWRLLMEPRFVELRNCIYRNETELAVFRQIVVNAVLATDLFDKNLNELRETRWKKLFVNQDITMAMS